MISELDKPDSLAFRYVRLPVAPLIQVECEVEIEGTKSFGYSAGLSIVKAKTRAHAEAVERHFARVKGADSSNGFAAHSSRRKAIDAAKLELLERAALMATWNRAGSWALLESGFAKFLNYWLARFVSGAEFKNYWVLVNGSYAVLFSVFDFEGGGFVFDARIEQGRSVSLRAIWSGFCSLVKAIPYYQRYSSEMLSESTVVFDMVSPIDHLRFYSLRSNKHHLYMQIGTCETAKVDLPYFNSVEVDAWPTGYSGLWVAHAWNPHWPKMVWGQAEGKAPHPLA